MPDRKPPIPTISPEIAFHVDNQKTFIPPTSSERKPRTQTRCLSSLWYLQKKPPVPVTESLIISLISPERVSCVSHWEPFSLSTSPEQIPQTQSESLCTAVISPELASHAGSHAATSPGNEVLYQGLSVLCRRNIFKDNNLYQCLHFISLQFSRKRSALFLTTSSEKRSTPHRPISLSNSRCKFFRKNEHCLPTISQEEEEALYMHFTYSQHTVPNVFRKRQAFHTAAKSPEETRRPVSPERGKYPTFSQNLRKKHVIQISPEKRQARHIAVESRGIIFAHYLQKGASTVHHIFGKNFARYL